MTDHQLGMQQNNFPEEMYEFLQKHHTMSLAVNIQNASWSFTCFYVFDREAQRFIFVSDTDTRHISAIETNNRVSGTVSNKESNVFQILGIQFTGRVYRAEGSYLSSSRKEFIKKFPVARLKKLQLWYVEIDYAKMTDNTILFASKSHWERNT